MSTNPGRTTLRTETDHSALSRRLFFASLLVLAALALFVFFFPQAPLEHTVQSGAVDVSALRSGSLVLSGDWELLEDTQHPERAGGYAFVPGQWERPYGYAAYHMNITGLDPGIQWALSTSYLDTSYRLYVDGIVALSAGSPGRTEAETVSSYRAGIAPLPAGARGVDLTLEVANFTHMRGGPYRGIVLGEESYLRRYDTWSFVTEIATICIMVFLGGLALLNAIVKRRMASLWFCLMLFSGAFGIFTLSSDFPVFRVFPSLGFGAYLRLAYFIVYLVPTWFFLVARSLFGGFSFTRTLHICMPTAILALCAVILPLRVFTSANSVYEINSLLLFALSIVIFIRALRRRYPYSVLLGLGFLTFLGIALGVMLYSNNRIYRGNLSALSFLYPLVGNSLAASLYLDIASYACSLVGLNLFCILFFIDSPKVTEPSPKAADEGYHAGVNATCAALGFSLREIEVTLLVLTGKRNKEIADALFVSENTVKTHLSRIFAKAGIKARSELFALFANC